MTRLQKRPRPAGSVWIVLSLLIAAFLIAPRWPAWAADCTVPGDYSTIQDAVADYGCDPINLADQVYAESLRIERSVTIVGPAGVGEIVGPAPVAEIAGLVEVKGSGNLAEFQDIRIDNGCSPNALVVTDLGQVGGDGLEVVRTNGGPCPPVIIGLIFADGFEAGDTSSWSSSVP